MIATVLFAATLGAAAPAAAAPAAPVTLADVNREVDLDEQLGRVLQLNRPFKDEHGTAVRLADYFNDGKPVVIVLAYFRCPSLCDLVLSSLVDALRALEWTPGAQFRVLTISIDPNDRPAEAARRQTLLLQKLGHPEAASGWPFLVGDEPQIRALAGELGFGYVYDPQSRLYAHPAALFVLTSQARISRYLYGVGYPARDVRLALIEAGQGRVGTIVDRILMTCYRYDPSTRRYGFLVFSVMRGGSLLVLLALGATIFFLRRRERAERVVNELNELFRTLLFLPPQSSTMARQIDALHYWVIGTTVAGAIGITLVGGYFLMRYRRGLGEEPPRQEGGPRPSGMLELAVIAGLFALFVLFWFIGNAQFTRLRVPPEDARPIYVTAKQWMWKFAYPEGARSISVLYVPAGQPIKLILTARDVIHSFYVPDFRVKEDAVPGRTTTLWFEAPEPGTHQILCAEYCGTGHSIMRGQVVVLSPADYARWLGGSPAGGISPATAYSAEPPPGEYVEPAVVDDFQTREGTDLVRLGERAAAQHGCLRCHSIDGSAYIAPTWAGLYRARVPLAGGQSVVADEAYLTESMMDPALKQVSGFPLVMPSYQGLLKPGETAAILELIRSLKDSVPRPAHTPVEPPPMTPDGRAPAPVRRVP